MVNDAKKHESEDKQKREKIDLANQAEHLVYETEKNINENGDRLDENDKKNLNEKLDALKKAKDSGDSELIKSSMESLNTVWSGLAQKMYEPGEQNPNPGPDNNKDSSTKSRKKEEGEIEDADFEVVD